MKLYCRSIEGTLANYCFKMTSAVVFRAITIVIATLGAMTSSAGHLPSQQQQSSELPQQHQQQQRSFYQNQQRGTSAASATSAILPAHLVLKADPLVKSPSSGSSSLPLSRSGRPSSVDNIGGGSRSSRLPQEVVEAIRLGGISTDDDNDGEDLDPKRYKLNSRRKQRLNKPSPADSLDGLPILPLRRRRPPLFAGGTSSVAGSDAYGPSPADIDSRALASLLGSDFDPAFMSPGRPNESLRHPNGTYLPVDEQDEIGGSTTSLLLAGLTPPLRLPAIRLPGGGHTSTKNTRIAIRGRDARSQVQRYLVAYSYCPVFVLWRDLGRFFWPRWIREGSCRGPPGENGLTRERSCSIPAGMSCRPSRSSTKTVLWWHCRTPSSSSLLSRSATISAAASSSAATSTRRLGQQLTQHDPSSLASTASSSSSLQQPSMVCGWIPIKYPVITACKCAC